MVVGKQSTPTLALEGGWDLHFLWKVLEKLKNLFSMTETDPWILQLIPNFCREIAMLLGRNQLPVLVKSENKSATEFHREKERFSK